MSSPQAIAHDRIVVIVWNTRLEQPEHWHTQGIRDEVPAEIIRIEPQGSLRTCSAPRARGEADNIGKASDRSGTNDFGVQP